MISLSARRQNLLICCVVLAATVAIYFQTAGFDFVRYDDKLYALNPHAIHGFTFDSLRWALFSYEDSNWLPLTRLTHILDNSLFGPAAGPSHVVNFLIHGAASLLVFWFLLRATGARWQSAFVSLLFAVHPLHVESVAWSAERKDVLCALFWFLSLWSWVGYTKAPTRPAYGRTVLFFCLGIMSKPMIVTLPAIMVLLDFWPLRRGISAKTLDEKIPFALISLVSGAITFLAQSRGGAVRSLAQVGLILRIENALVAWAVYPLKTLWPTNLAIMYPFPEAIPITEAAICAIALLLASTAAICLRHRFPWLTTGWFWYLVATLPVIGLIPVGRQAYADRYMYIPMVGLGIVLAWGSAELVVRWPVARIPIAASGVAALAAWSVCAGIQAGYWRNSEALFRHTLAVTENNYVAWENLGSELSHTPGRLSEAIACFESAIKIDPNSAIAHGSLCAALQNAGRFPQAEAECRTALRLDPAYWEAHTNLAAVLTVVGRPQEAISECRAALKVNPSAVEPHIDLGQLLFSAGKLPEALAEDSAALALDPGRATVHYARGQVLLRMGDAQAAADEFETALRIAPGYAPAHTMLGSALMKLPGGPLEAYGEFAAALRIDPNLALAHANLGLALADAGRIDEAREQLTVAVRLDPQPAWTAALNRLK